MVVCGLAGPLSTVAVPVQMKRPDVDPVREKLVAHIMPDEREAVSCSVFPEKLPPVTCQLAAWQMVPETVPPVIWIAVAVGWRFTLK